MDFIRTSWNNLLSSDEFQQLFTQRSDQIQIIFQLFDIIGYFSGKEKFDFEEDFFQNHNELQLPILYEYLFVSLNTTPHLFINTILDCSLPKDAKICDWHFRLNKKLNMLGFIRFLSQYGDQLFENHNNTDIKKYSYCCLLILQSCISFGYNKYSLDYSKFTNNDINFINSYEFYVSEIAISKLASSYEFNILIAYSRLFYKNEIINTRKMFTKRINLTIKKFSTNAEDSYFRLHNNICFDESDKCEMLLILNGLNTWRILKFIIFSDRPYINSKISLLPRSEVMLYVASDLQTIHKNPHLFEYASIDCLYASYINTISKFMSFPSLYLAYMSTTFLVQYISYAENHSLKTATDTNILSTFEESKVLELFSNLKQFLFLDSESKPEQEESFDETNNNESLPFSNPTNLNVNHMQLSAFEGQISPKYGKLGYILNYEKLGFYFTQIPKRKLTSTEVESIYELIFQYPAFSSLAISYFLEKMEIDDIHFCAKISREILKSYENLQDFRIYIFKYGKFFELIMQLLRVSSITVEEEHFYPIWLLALSLLRLTWGSGSVGIYERSKIFVDAVEPAPIRFILRWLLQIEPEKENLSLSREDCYIIEDRNQPEKDDILGFSVFYPFYIAARTLDGLLNGSLYLSNVIKYVSDHPFLWPSVLLYAYKFPTPENRNILSSAKQPNQELIKLLFKQVMLRMMNDSSASKKSIVASEMLDLMVMKENPPHSTNEIKYILLKHIQILITPSTLRYSLIIGISNIWIALAEHFGFDVFGKVFIHEIIKKMSSFDSYNGYDEFDLKPSFLDNDSSLSLFVNSLGHVFAIFLNSEPNRMKASINMLIDIVDNEDDLFSNSNIILSVAQFAIIIINDTKEEWKQTFSDLIKKCNNIIMNSASNLNNKKCIFALSFIRISLIIPKFRELLVNDDLTFQTLINANDFSTIIDYLITKDLSINI